MRRSCSSTTHLDGQMGTVVWDVAGSAADRVGLGDPVVLGVAAHAIRLLGACVDLDLVILALVENLGDVVAGILVLHLDLGPGGGKGTRGIEAVDGLAEGEHRVFVAGKDGRLTGREVKGERGELGGIGSTIVELTILAIFVPHVDGHFLGRGVLDRDAVGMVPNGIHEHHVAAVWTARVGFVVDVLATGCGGSTKGRPVVGAALKTSPEIVKESGEFARVDTGCSGFGAGCSGARSLVGGRRRGRGDRQRRRRRRRRVRCAIRIAVIHLGPVDTEFIPVDFVPIDARETTQVSLKPGTALARGVEVLLSRTKVLISMDFVMHMSMGSARP